MQNELLNNIDFSQSIMLTGPYTVKKCYCFSAPGRDVTNQSLPVQDD